MGEADFFYHVVISALPRHRLKCVCGWWLTERRTIQEWKMHCSLRGDAKYKEDIVNPGYTGAAQTKKKEVQSVLLR